MRGHYHVLISFLGPFSVIYPLYRLAMINENVLIVMIIGIFLGSLVPDVDASDAHILHGELREIGLFFKYVIYNPVAYLAERIFKIKKRHRGIMHSVLGIFLFQLILFSILLIIEIIYSHYESVSLHYLLMLNGYFFLAFTIGCILHIIEDGYTISGVMPFLPKQIRLSGNIRTFSKKEDRFGGALIIVLGAIFIYAYITLEYITALLLTIITYLASNIIAKKFFAER